MKRGKDHHWQLIKYKGNMGIYAKCKCGYEYPCYSGGKLPFYITNESGALVPADPSKLMLYRYCPRCGARKKWYIEEIKRADESWEDRFLKV